MCHPVYALHSCNHKGQYLAFVQCEHIANSRELLARVNRVSNLQLRLDINDRLCKEDRRERYEREKGICARCKGKGKETVDRGDRGPAGGESEASGAKKGECSSAARGKSAKTAEGSDDSVSF